MLYLIDLSLSLFEPLLIFCFEKKVRLLCYCFTFSRYLVSKDIFDSFALFKRYQCLYCSKDFVGSFALRIRYLCQFGLGMGH